MRNLIILILLFPALVQAQLMAYYSNQSPASPGVIFDGDWSPPGEWRDSIGAINILDNGTLPVNVIRLLVNTRTELNAYAFRVNCPGGYVVKWSARSSGVPQVFSSGEYADHAYDTTKCQKYCVIEIYPVDPASNITSFIVANSTLRRQNNINYPSYLWVAANYASTAPVMYSSNVLCMKLHAVWLSGITSIPSAAFYLCGGMQSVIFPSSCTSIAPNAFQSCSSLTRVTLPPNLTTLGNSAFQACSNLVSINVPTGVTSIGNSCFEACYCLQYLTMPTSLLTTLGSSIFKSCLSLVSVTLPSSITAMSNQIFSSCYNLRHVTYKGAMTTATNCYGLFSSNECMDTLSFAGGKFTRFMFSGTAGKVNKLGGSGNLHNDSIPIRINWSGSTFADAAAPQLDLTYNSLDTTQIQKIFRCLPTVTGKTVSVVGCSGAASLSNYTKSIATSKGWTVLN
jgi:hypothetical protein